MEKDDNNALCENEVKICELLKKGYDIDRIARTLLISNHTVKSHINKIKKLHLN